MGNNIPISTSTLGVAGWRRNLKEKFTELWKKLVSVDDSLNPDAAALGRLFNTLMVISIGIVLILAVAFLLMLPLHLAGSSVIQLAVVFPLAFIPLSSLSIYLSRRGHVKLSILLYVWINFLAIGIAAWLYDGIYSPAWTLFIWTITIAGTLLAPAYALWMTGGVLIYFVLLGTLTLSGNYIPPLTFGINGREYVSLACLMIMLVSTVGLLTYLNMHNLHQALQILHKEIADHRKTEKELRRLEEESERIFNTVPDLIAILDLQHGIVKANQSLIRRLELSPSDCIGKKCYEAIHCMEEPPKDCPHTLLIRDGQEHTVEVIEERLGGIFVVTDSPLHDENGQLIGSVHVARDITERKQVEDKLEYASSHDALTGLFNRAYFESKLNRLELERQFPISIVMVDVDGMKAINDSQGHAAGDGMLQRASQLLLAGFRSSDVVARIGGDEFVVVLPSTDKEKAAWVVDRVKTFLETHNHSTEGLPLQVSIGVATSETDGKLSDILKKADDRMYQEKHKKRLLNSAA